MQQQRSTMLKVLCPVEGRNGKTFWIRIGNAFINRDGSTNVYLNAYPTSGKLQIRELDERQPGAGAPPGLGTGDYGSGGGSGAGSGEGDELPF